MAKDKPEQVTVDPTRQIVDGVWHLTARALSQWIAYSAMPGEDGAPMLSPGDVQHLAETATRLSQSLADRTEPHLPSRRLRKR